MLKKVRTILQSRLLGGDCGGLCCHESFLKSSAHGSLHFHEFFYPLSNRRVCGEQVCKGTSGNCWYDKECIHAFYFPQVTCGDTLHCTTYLEKCACQLAWLASDKSAISIGNILSVPRNRSDYQKAGNPCDDCD